MKLKSLMEDSNLSKDLGKMMNSSDNGKFAKVNSTIIGLLQKYGVGLQSNPILKKEHQKLFVDIKTLLDNFGTKNQLY